MIGDILRLIGIDTSRHLSREERLREAVKESLKYQQPIGGLGRYSTNVELTILSNPYFQLNNKPTHNPSHNN